MGKEAMQLPCCKKSVCRRCVERDSSKNGKFTCNHCGSDRYTIKDLKPNLTLRAVIDELTRTYRKPEDTTEETNTLAKPLMQFGATVSCVNRSTVRQPRSHSLSVLSCLCVNDIHCMATGNRSLPPYVFHRRNGVWNSLHRYGRSGAW